MRHRSSVLSEPGIASIAIALTLSSFATAAAAQGRGIDVQRSTITVHVFKSGLFRAFADNHVIQAPLAQGLVDDSTAPRVELAVDASRMRVLDPGLSPRDREDVQARMLGPEVLDTNRFAQIRFSSTSIEQVNPDHWVVQGNLDLHGQVHPVKLQVSRENGRYTGSASLRQTDFAITPISVAGGTVKVKDEITIDFVIVTAGQ